MQTNCHSINELREYIDHTYFITKGLIYVQISCTNDLVLILIKIRKVEITSFVLASHVKVYCDIVQKNTAKRNKKPLVYGTADMTSPY